MNSSYSGSITKENILNKKLAQAYLVCASSADAAKEAARIYIKSILCENGTACGKCLSCVKFDSGNHIDYLEIKSDNQINKNDIQELPYFLSVKSFEGSYRCIHIADADKMNMTVQNKLLKSFEDPPENTVFMLSTGAYEKLLPTVISRCVRINVNADEKLNAELDEKLKIALNFSGGFIKKANELLEDDGFLKARNSAVDICKRIITGKLPVFVISSEILQNGKYIKEMLFAMAGFFTDAVEYKLCKMMPKYSPDCKKEIEGCNMPTQKLMRIASTISEYSQNMERNPNVSDRLMIESMLFDISDIIKEK